MLSWWFWSVHCLANIISRNPSLCQKNGRLWPFLTSCVTRLWESADPPMCNKHWGYFRSHSSISPCYQGGSTLEGARHRKGIFVHWSFLLTLVCFCWVCLYIIIDSTNRLQRESGDILVSSKDNLLMIQIGFVWLGQVILATLPKTCWLRQVILASLPRTCWLRQVILATLPSTCWLRLVTLATLPQTCCSQNYA